MSKTFIDYAAYYDLIYQDKNYAKETDYIEKLFTKHSLAKVRKLVDIGCGTGRHAEELFKRGYEVFGVDISADMLNIATRKLPQMKTINASATGFVLPETIDTAISLFHVMSYQTTSKELLQVFNNVKQHLTTSGLFIFDFWNGAAVQLDPPELRENTFENDKLVVFRKSTPEIFQEKHLINVNFEVSIKDKVSGTENKIQETHSMRYWFPEEISVLAKQAGFVVVAEHEFMTSEPISNENWNGLVVLRKG